MDDIILYDMKRFPEVPKDWTYQKSVNKMRKLVVNWKNISVEILQEDTLNWDTESTVKNKDINIRLKSINFKTHKF